MTTRRRSWTGWLYLAPAAVLLLVFAYWPFVSAMRLALYETNGLGLERFVGLGNFASVLGDSLFANSFRVLLTYALLFVPIAVFGPLVGAKLVHSVASPRLASAYRVVFVLPVMIPAVVLVLVWRNLYGIDGAINQALSLVGLGEWRRGWLGDAATVLPAIVFIGFPFVGGVNFLIYLAGLINIPSSLHEAAHLDGASRWQVFTRVDLPLLLPQMRLIVTLSIIAVVHSYEHILVLTGGGPGNSSLVPALYLFRHGFEWGNLGVASAVGCLLMLFALGLTAANIRFLRVRE